MSDRRSRRPQDVEAARVFLLTTLDRTEAALPRYGEVARAYGGVARGVAPVLNSIAAQCRAQKQPDLSVLVVLDKTGLPGQLNGEPLDPADPASRARWQDELQRVRTHDWSR